MPIASRRLTPLLACITSLACARPQPPGPSEPSGPGADAGAIEAPGRSFGLDLELHPIGVREGNLELARIGDRAYLLVDGEPVPLVPGAAPTRRPELGRGLAPRESFLGPGLQVIAIGGDLDAGQGYLSTREDFERAGSRFGSYVRTAAGWQQQQFGHAPLQGYYEAVLPMPGGAWLGLRSFELEFGEMPELAYEDSPEAAAYWAELQGQRQAAPAGFELLGGELAAIPQLPSGWIISDAVATDAGRVIALGHQPIPPTADDPWPSPTVQVLDWAPGATEPAIRTLPELAPSTAVWALHLWPAGDQVVVSAWEEQEDGTDLGPYLAIGDGERWQPIPVELPGVDPTPISSATLGPDGQPWITIGAVYDQPREAASLWRHDAGTWLPVELPEVGPERWDNRPRWIFNVPEQRWVELPAGDASEIPTPTATRVLWADKSLWVVAQLGRAYPQSDELWTPDNRTVVYASRPIADGSITTLPSYDVVERERVDGRAKAQALRPGEPGCERFTLVALDRPSSRGPERAALIATLTKLETLPQHDGASVTAAYIGAVFDDPGHDQLVLDGVTWASEPQAELLREQVARALGVPVTADCRPRALVEMIRQDP